MLAHMALGVLRTKYGTAHTVQVRRAAQCTRENVELCESLDDQLAKAMTPAKPQARVEVAAELARAVSALPDWELIARLKHAPAEQLNKWEQNFTKGKYARRIVEKLERKKT